MADKQVLELVRLTLPSENFREWYWALMDYGTHLKATVGNSSRRSQHYKRQSAFGGSRRQVRGKVLRALADGPKNRLDLGLAITDDRLDSVIQDMLTEQLIWGDDSGYRL